MTKPTYKDIARSVVTQLDDKNIAANLAAYLVSERRVSDLGKVMREVERIRYEEHGILETEVSSAREITTEIEQQIKELFSGDKVQINKQIDKDLVGGVKIQAGETLIDLSIRGQLNQLKAHNF